MKRLMTTNVIPLSVLIDMTSLISQILSMPVVHYSPLQGGLCVTDGLIIHLYK